MIKIIPGKNPHHIKTKTENEIMKEAEKENGKKRASTSGVGSIQDYMPPTTSATTSSLQQTWDNCLKSQTTQQRGRQPFTTATMPSQPRSFSSLWRK